MADPRISEPQCGTIREAGINFKSKDIGIVSEAVLLERAALLERILHCFTINKNTKSFLIIKLTTDHWSKP